MQKLDCLKDSDLFETMCEILNIPMEGKKIWARRRLMPWSRANTIAWLYDYAKKHMSRHGRVYSGYQLDIGAGAFKRAFVTHRNAVTTAVKIRKQRVEAQKCWRTQKLKVQNQCHRRKRWNIDKRSKEQEAKRKKIRRK